jgi:hypothetical protein
VFEFVPYNFFWEDFEELVDLAGDYNAVGIYSSKTGIWSNMGVLVQARGVLPMESSVFLRGKLYLSAYNFMVVVVDLEENNLRYIYTHVYVIAEGTHAIYLSEGQLHLAHKGDSELSTWILEGENWTLKHNVSYVQLFGEVYSSIENDYNIISIHRERNVVFIVCGPEKLLISYDMDCWELRVMHQLEWDCTAPYIPYVPLFSELLADGN